MTASQDTWYVVADGKQVRIMLRGEHTLRPHLAFDAAGHGDPDHDPDRSAGHIHAPGTDPHTQAKHNFARHVAKHLNEAVETGGVKRIYLAASAHVLHDIVAALSKRAEGALVERLSKDLIHNDPADILAHFKPDAG